MPKKAKKRTQIEPGDIVQNLLHPELDYREVVTIGDDWLTLNFGGRESAPLPRNIYAIVVPHEREPGEFVPPRERS